VSTSRRASRPPGRGWLRPGLALWIGFPVVLWIGAIVHENTR
jgi:hypothetical protein